MTAQRDEVVEAVEPLVRQLQADWSEAVEPIMLTDVVIVATYRVLEGDKVEDYIVNIVTENTPLWTAIGMLEFKLQDMRASIQQEGD